MSFVVGSEFMLFRIICQMLLNILKHTFNKSKVTHFSAHKYMKSVTETALLYRPQQMLNLTTD
jgi:hypothetical protein